MAGKISVIFVTLLMINIVGYLLMNSMVAEGIAEANPYVTENTLLVKFFSPVEVAAAGGGTNTIYMMDNNSALFGSVPLEPPESFLSGVGDFIDRIFVLFGFLRTILGVVLFPVALVSFMGLPWQLAMLFFPPLMVLYILGLIDLFSGGDS